MEPIKTQDVWIEKEPEGENVWLEKKSDMVVMTKAEFDKILEEERQKVRAEMDEIIETEKEFAYNIGYQNGSYHV